MTKYDAGGGLCGAYFDTGAVLQQTTMEREMFQHTNISVQCQYVCGGVVSKHKHTSELFFNRTFPVIKLVSIGGNQCQIGRTIADQVTSIVIGTIAHRHHTQLMIQHHT